MARTGHPFNKRPYTLEAIAQMNKELQRYKAEAEAPKLQCELRQAHTSRGRQSKSFIPFPSQSPEVRAKALVILEQLKEKHKAKLAAKGNKTYYGILCGVAVAQAKRELGLIISCKAAWRKGWYRRRRMSSLRTSLGLQDRASRDMTHVYANQPPLQVTQANLDGI